MLVRWFNDHEARPGWEHLHVLQRWMFGQPTQQEVHAQYNGAAVLSHTPMAQPAEKLLIQDLGATGGCHICGVKYPRRTYEADHLPPGIFYVPWMSELLRRLQIQVPGRPVLRPHCPRCSNQQGRTIAAVIFKAETVAAAMGIRVIRPSGIVIVD